MPPSLPPSPSPYHHPCYDITISFVIIFWTSPPCSSLSSAMIRCVMLKDKTISNPSNCFAALLARRRSEPALHLRSLKGEALAHIHMCFGATVGPWARGPAGSRARGLHHPAVARTSMPSCLVFVSAAKAVGQEKTCHAWGCGAQGRGHRDLGARGGLNF